MSQIKELETLSNIYSAFAETFSKQEFSHDELVFSNDFSIGESVIDFDLNALTEKQDLDFDLLSESEKKQSSFVHMILPYLLCNNGVRLKAYGVGCNIAIAEYASAIADSVNVRANLVCALSMRALIEKVAQLNATVKNIESVIDERYRVPAINHLEVHVRREFALSAREVLNETLSDSRFPWELAARHGTTRLSSSQLRNARRKRTVADEEKPSQIQQKKGIMSHVDLLEKSIKGTRSHYDFLSEFTHPNAVQHRVYEQRRVVTKFSRLELGPDRIQICGTAGGSSEELRIGEVLLIEYTRLMEDMFVHTHELLERLSKASNILCKNEQALVKQSIKEIPIFCEKDPCPCGSTLTIDACCGRKLRHLMRVPSSREALFSNLVKHTEA